MLKRRRLAQSLGDLVIAGKVAMLAFLGDQGVSGLQGKGNSAAVTEILSLNCVPLGYLYGSADPSLPPLFESAEFRGEVERHRGPPRRPRRRPRRRGRAALRRRRAT